MQLFSVDWKTRDLTRLSFGLVAKTCACVWAAASCFFNFISALSNLVVVLVPLVRNNKIVLS